MKFDRGMIKWQPFDSVISSKNVINSLLHEKEKVNKPVLSEEETEALEEKIIDAFYSQEVISLDFYKNGYIKTITGQIKKIDHISKTIYLNSTLLLFKQILSIHSQVQ